MDFITVDLDYFPAKVTLPSGAVFKVARVYVANGEVIVYTASNGKVTEIFRRSLQSVEGDRRRGFLFLVEGGTMKVVKAAGCGCNSPLKRYNPWSGVRRMAGSL